jgi:hypothetical protein
VWLPAWLLTNAPGLALWCSPSPAPGQAPVGRVLSSLGTGLSYLVDHGAADQAASEVVRGYPSGTAPDSPVGHGTGTGQRGNGEPLLFGLGQYFVDAGLIFCQADTPGQVGLSAAELAWPGNPDMPHMPESDVTFDTPRAGPGTARVNVMVGPVIPTI